MSDDLSNKINQISEMLGQDTMPDNLKNLIGLLAGSFSGNKEESPREKDPIDVKEDKSPKSETDDNLDLMRKVSKVMNKLNTANDPRVNLLTAIKPFMSSKRQQKLNNCIRILQVSSLTRLMDD
jgi:hypothetical protein